MTLIGIGKAENPSEQHPMGVTVDGVHIEPGLAVWTNEYRAGIVTDRLRHNDGWFDVRYPNGRTVMQNPERVATAFEGKRAINELQKQVSLDNVEVSLYVRYHDGDEHIGIQIDTQPGRHVRVMLNDADLFHGNPDNQED